MKLAFWFLGIGLTMSVVLTLLIGVYIKDGRNGKEQGIAGLFQVLFSVIGSVGTFMYVADNAGSTGIIALFIIIFFPTGILGLVRASVCLKAYNADKSVPKDNSVNSLMQNDGREFNGNAQNCSGLIPAAQRGRQKINVKQKYTSQLIEDVDELNKYLEYCLDAFDKYESDRTTNDQVNKFINDVYARIATLDDQEKTLSAALSIYKNEARKRRRILVSLAVAVVVICTGVAIGVSSCTVHNSKLLYELNETGYTVSAGKYYDETDVVIPATYNGKKVTKIANSAFSYVKNKENIKSITIPNSVTSIGDSAFWGCSSLTSITIPNSVTSIGGSAFEDCSKLTSITIPNGITTIVYRTFSGCSSLTSVTIGNSVTSIGSEAFYNCSSLTSVTIGNSVTSIGSEAFYNCSSLTSVTIPNSVTSIGREAFSYCTSLKTIYCEAASEPDGWSSGWKGTSCSATVQYGYTE